MKTFFLMGAGRQPGYSLVFAFMIMTVIMIVASTTISNTTGKIRYFNELEGGSQARLSAESAAELAIVAIKDYEAGYEIELTEDAFCLDFDGDWDCEASGDYEVVATGQENDNGGTGYYTPIPGTGSAAPSSICVFDLDDPEDVDHPCNWNKLLYGDSVTIPLFNDNGDGTTDDLTDLGFTGWELKVRTPCEDVADGDYEEDCLRYEFYGVITDADGTFTVYDEDPTLLSWQFYGEDSSGTSFSYIPDDTPGTDDYYYFEDRDYDYNTEISEHSINSAYDNGDYIILTGENDYSGTFEFNTVESTSSHSKTIEAIYDELYLQFEIVHPMIDSTDIYTIPYLEWQFVLTGSTKGLADSGSVLTGYGYSENHSRTYFHYFYEKYLTTGGRGGVYTLSN